MRKKMHQIRQLGASSRGIDEASGDEEGLSLEEKIDMIFEAVVKCQVDSDSNIQGEKES